jgi:hypothetical protein
MSYQNPHRKSSITFMTVIAFLAIVPTLWAQTERREPQSTSTPKVLIFKSKGVSRPANRGAQPSSAPPALSLVQKNQILKSLNLPALTGPGSVYVKLNTRDTYVADKGFLNFIKAKVMDGGGESGYTSLGWGSQPKDNVVEIHLKSEAAGRRYLIDCRVNSWQGHGTFKIWNGNGDLLQTIEGTGPQASHGQHLVFVLEAADDGWHEFRIAGNSDWWFYSCEVTNL